MNTELLAYLDARSHWVGECLEWKLSTGSHGYGQGYWEGKVDLVHRLQWKAVHGSIPTGIKVLHDCDNRRCRRQDHLFLGTDKDNCDDKLAKGRGGYVNHGDKVRRGIIEKHGDDWVAILQARRWGPRQGESS